MSKAANLKKLQKALKDSGQEKKAKKLDKAIKNASEGDSVGRLQKALSEGKTLEQFLKGNIKKVEAALKKEFKDKGVKVTMGSTNDYALGS